MKKESRQIQIHSLLLENERMKVKDLSKILDVTTETIRSDLETMQSQYLVIKEHGWVRLNRSLSERPLSFRENENADRKRLVCIRAMREVKDGQTIFLDGGSTILSGLDSLQSKKDITVVTHSIKVALKCSEMNIRTILAGGEIYRTGERTSGYFTTYLIDHMIFDVAIVGTLGIKNIDGFTTVSIEGIDILRHVINQSRRIIVVSDSSKFDQEANYCFCKFKEIDTLVTDEITDEQRNIVKDVKEIINIEKRL